MQDQFIDKLAEILRISK